MLYISSAATTVYSGVRTYLLELNSLITSSFTVLTDTPFGFIDIPIYVTILCAIYLNLSV